MGPQCGVDPLDFLPQRPPLPGLLRGVEVHTRSTRAVRFRKMRRFVYDFRDFVEVVRRLKEDYKTR